jgi:hypothetical protein
VSDNESVRPDDGNWRMLSSRERKYLEHIESEAQRAGQLGINCEWLIAQLDAIHDVLCPDHIGTWQSRAQKAVEAAKIIKQNKELSPSSTVSPKDTDALLATIRKHVEKIPCHDCRSVPCWYCELKRLIANGH